MPEMGKQTKHILIINHSIIYFIPFYCRIPQPNTPLYGYATCYLSVYLMIDIWIVFSFLAIRKNADMNICVWTQDFSCHYSSSRIAESRGSSMFIV